MHLVFWLIKIDLTFIVCRVSCISVKFNKSIKSSSSIQLYPGDKFDYSSLFFSTTTYVTWLYTPKLFLPKAFIDVYTSYFNQSSFHFTFEFYEDSLHSVCVCLLTKYWFLLENSDIIDLIKGVSKKMSLSEISKICSDYVSIYNH